MEIIGILVQKLNERSGISQSNGQAWKSAEYLIEMPAMNYPKHMVVSVMDGLDGRLARFDAVLGKTVKLRFDIDAREYQGRWFNDIRAYAATEYVAQATSTQGGGDGHGSQEPATHESQAAVNGGFGASDTPGNATRKEQQGNIQFGDDKPPF